MRLVAEDRDGRTLADLTMFSTGGGFIADASDFGAGARVPRHAWAQPYRSAAELLQRCADQGCTIAELAMENELGLRPCDEVVRGLDAIREAMFECIDRGLSQEGFLPGVLKVPRRARELLRSLEAHEGAARPMAELDWVNAFAVAVNEENAAGGRVVTAPTNGAAGIIPAVLRFHEQFCKPSRPQASRDFLLTAAAIGSLYKENASISGAEVGCQGEVGVASSMAAAGLAAVLGGTNEQIENAAEIGMEHNLGLTCDPVGGLVQIPCIERNAMGAVKAINAAYLALSGNGQHHVSLDRVIETMKQTGADMHLKYKETSLGGLAVSVVAC
jgi:L-serine dehydratase